MDTESDIINKGINKERNKLQGEDLKLFELLKKWLTGFENVNSPEKYAESIFNKYPPKLIGKALNDNSCVSTANFYNLIEFYKKNMKLCKKNLRRIEKSLDPVPHEDFESEFFATWLRESGLKFTHIANERMTSAKHGAKLKRIGVSAGVPDFMIILPHDDPERESRLMFIEMKRAEKSFSAISPEQHEWNVALDNCLNHDLFD